MLCEGIFDESNINQELEIFDLNSFGKNNNYISALEIVCFASVLNYQVVSKCTKFFVIPVGGDNAPVKIADVTTYQAEQIHKINFEIKTNRNKIIASAEKAGSKYSVFILEHKMFA